LEQLETQFYSEALAKFQMTDFVAAGFQNAQVPMQQLTQIGSDEATHASALQVHKIITFSQDLILN
jgi:Ferritin-like domain